MRNFAAFFVFTFTWVLLTSQTLLAARPYGGRYTAERVANLRNNCEKYDWARQMREAAIINAKPWVSIKDEELWAMVPGQDLPRCIDVTFDRLTTGPKFLGCLKCGDKISQYGNYPYNPDFVNKPWKLTCPSCKSVFPTNDFAKYYSSALDKNGLFNPALGDRKLLYNADHPDPKDPLHKFGVDDGFGYIDQNGRAHRFIGYYTWKYWMYLNNGLSALADAYLYTGDKQYAHKAAILLDRIADVYPSMDWKPYADRGWYHSDGGTHMGKIEGSIWETNVIQRFADSYDKILSGTQDDPSLYAFLRTQSQKYRLPNTKGTRDLFVQNVDDGILRAAYKGVLSGQIRGNQGMHQLTVAMCAVALNSEPETTQWLDWLFAPEGGAIPGLMVNQFDRDGTTDEGAPGYTFMWGDLITKLASLLGDYPAYTKHNIIRDFPQFGATFTAAYRLAVLGKAIPNIGDAGSTGSVSKSYVNPKFMAQGYQFTRNPEIAIAAYRANNNSAQGLGRDIFSKDPEALSTEIKRIAEKAGPRPVGGYLMSGFGLALLEAEAGKSGVALAGNYGRTIKHAHPDMLNFDLFAFDRWLAPDLGYPEFATNMPNNTEWNGSTISHNTVLVNQKPQKEIWSGSTQLFKQLKGFGVFQIDGKKAYPDLKEYNRTLFLIGGDGSSQDSNAYVVDIFRVVGGQDHLYSFHGPPGEIKTTGLKLQVQPKGTYAGENIPKGAAAKGFPIGYSFLYNVRRDQKPPTQFTLDWQAQAGYRGLTDKDGVHLRFHALTPTQDVAMAHGDPPQNKPGNPKQLGYLLMHRTGTDLNSTFVSVIEPYRHQPFIKSVQRIDDGKGTAVAIKVERVDGTTDFVLFNPEENKPWQLPNGLALTGKIGYVRESDGKANQGVLVNGSALKYGKLNLKSDGVITGKVVQMNKEQAGGGWLVVDAKLPTDGSLKGEQIMVETTGERDACYTIQDVKRQGKQTKVFCGPVSFVQAYQGPTMVVRTARVPQDYTKGYIYDFEEGAPFKIILHQAYKAKAK